MRDAERAIGRDPDPRPVLWIDGARSGLRLRLASDPRDVEARAGAYADLRIVAAADRADREGLMQHTVAQSRHWIAPMLP